MDQLMVTGVFGLLGLLVLSLVVVEYKQGMMWCTNGSFFSEPLLFKSSVLALFHELELWSQSWPIKLILDSLIRIVTIKEGHTEDY